MSTKRSFAAVPDFVAKMAAEAPGGEAVAPQASPSAPQIEPVEPAQRPVFREREATQRMTVNVPKALYEELRAYMKLTDVPMSEVLIDGLRRELARLKRSGE